MATTISTKLTQVHQYVWFGTCESELCDDELFEEWGSKFLAVKENIIEISTLEEGVLKTYRPSGMYPTTGPGVGQLDRFRCGYMYSITLTKTGSIEMENMYPSNQNSIQGKYGVSSTCSALGDIGLSCIPDGYTAFYYTNSEADTLDDETEGGQDVDEIQLWLQNNEDGIRTICDPDEGLDTCVTYGSFMWNRGGKRDSNSYFSLDLNSLKSRIDDPGDSPPISFNVKVGKETDQNPRLVGYLTLQSRPDAATDFHFFENATCYKATITPAEADQSVQDQGEADLFLEEVWSSSIMCTFQNPDDSEGEPIVYQSFEVGPDFNDVTTGSVQPRGFSYQGELRVPPAGDASDEDLRIGFWFVKDGVIDTDEGEVGSVTYSKSLPKTSSDFSLGAYFFVKSGSFTGKCLYGVITGADKCYLGE